MNKTNTIHSAASFENQEGHPLINYLLHLADDALILGHRNSEWCGHGPVLELDIAITNIALDLLGQARNFYQYAAGQLNKENETGEVTEDTLAYWRNARAFKNCVLVELPKGDWGVTVMRQFFYSTYQYYLYQQLVHSKDAGVAAISAKALKEVTYHVRWSSEWIIRLGKGTEESHARMINAVNNLENYTQELFVPAGYEAFAAAGGYGTDVATLYKPWLQKVTEIFGRASLDETLPFEHTGTLPLGKEGQHTGYLDEILTDLQFLQRKYPGAAW
ncbi:MAG TPA: 1,2-phenylacetyl-CoA epoxidase subunit PaaC [Chitinophagaceae bacterium]|nr:1,2-phenylacetyl-CoA epoxidase subunit PaaC [Chitinophagaceae bacterium]